MVKSHGNLLKNLKNLESLIKFAYMCCSEPPSKYNVDAHSQIHTPKEGQRMNTMKVTYLKLKLKADLKADLARPCPRVKFFSFRSAHRNLRSSSRESVFTSTTWPQQRITVEKTTSSGSLHRQPFLGAQLGLKGHRLLVKECSVERELTVWEALSVKERRLRDM